MASSKSKLNPLSRNIVRHTNKNGDYYYYNYKQNKITSGDSWKAQNDRIKKRNEQIEEQERKHRQYLKRKRESEKEKEQEKRHRQSLKRKREAKKKKKPVLAPVSIDKKVLPRMFYFYNARAVFNDPVFDGVKITITINDTTNDFKDSFDGSAEEFSEWYTITGTYLHLRDNYNDSPVAEFRLKKTDNKTFANYIIETQ